jgi:putative flippase GtrA
MNHREFLAFAVAGGIAAGVNWLSRMGLSGWLGLGWAVIVAYGIGMLTAYLLNRLFVFEASGRGSASEMTRFALVNLVAVLQVWLVTIGLRYYLLPAVGWTWQAENIAHAVGVASPIVTSYLAHKHFTFRKVPSVPGR